jgi:Tfp pilus assembly protein PilP
MMRDQNAKSVYMVVLIFTLFLLSCGEDEPKTEFKDFGSPKSGPGNAASEARKRAEKKRNPGLAAEENPSDTDNKLELPSLTESSFIADARRRDPFSPFLEVLIKEDKTAVEVQRDVKLKDYDVSELKLIGIITDIGDDRAMVTTPDKTGYVLKRGDYVGRADFIKQGNDGDTIQVNWRVARINGAGKDEERGIYLVRDDPTTSRGVDVTRFIPLHPVTN